MKQALLEVATVGENNEIILPAEYLEALGVKPGDVVQLRLEAGNIVLKRRLTLREIISKYAAPGDGKTLEKLREERGWNDYT
jgi:AbrB family looped-hinge helix DNA binding protein